MGIMGRRHKKAVPGEFKELRPPVMLAPSGNAGKQVLAPPIDGLQREPAFPPLIKPRLTCRLVGYFRGRRIFETGRSFFCLH